MNCPDCGKELTNIYLVRSIELQKDGEKWIEKNVFLSSASCLNCNEELSQEVIGELGDDIHRWGL